ncbi:MAG TPA: glycosyltransferase family 2 protein [Flavobacterium sp.]|jgi:GT2 family glycosyltransferase
MQLSVVILNYNVRYFLEQCVDSVRRAIANIDAEIIVVDNNSTDDSCSMMKQRFPEITLIENKENVGFPKGNNIGVARAKGEYICILNPDTVVAEDTFLKVLNFARDKEDVGIVGVKLIDGRGRFLPESKRGTPTPYVASTKIFGLYKLFPNLSFLNRYYAGHLSKTQTGKVDILVGAFMVMKRQLYLDVGGFDEQCFMYSDDIDLSYTVLKSGKSNYYFADTTVIHYKGESTVKDGEYVRRFSEAMNFFYKKHFQPSALFNIMMKGGAYLFAIAKSKKKSSSQEIEQYLLASEDEAIAAVLSKSLNKKVQLISFPLPEEDMLINKVHTELIFDTRNIQYVEMIEIMSKLNVPNLTFKVLHYKSGFMIGSNSSDDRGEVVSIPFSKIPHK